MDQDRAVAAGVLQEYHPGFDEKTISLSSVHRLVSEHLAANERVSNATAGWLQDCLLGFVSRVTKAAARNCAIESRKSITAHDLLCVLRESPEFRPWGETVRACVHAYRAAEASDRLSKRKDNPMASAFMGPPHVGRPSSMGALAPAGSKTSSSPRKRNRPQQEPWGSQKRAALHDSY
jgi:histone H3/H4